MWEAYALSEMLIIIRCKLAVEKTDAAYLNPLAYPPYEPVEERLLVNDLEPCVLADQYRLGAGFSLGRSTTA